jgi:hypothetical protein
VKPFRRLLFHGLVALSVMLIVATAILWTRSYWVYDIVGFPLFGPQQFATLNQVRGRIQLTVYVAAPNELVHPLRIESHSLDELESVLPQSTSTDMMLHPPFFECRYTDASHSGIMLRFYAFSLPHWLIVALFTLGLSFPVQRWRLRKHACVNRCPICGYDLRATPDRCPECGSIPPKKV